MLDESYTNLNSTPNLELKKKATRLDHVALNVSDIYESASWYQENLGADLLYRDESWAMLKVGESKIALTVASQHPPHLGFEVEELSDIPSKEVSYHRDGSAYCYTTDPDGNTIEFVYYPSSP